MNTLEPFAEYVQIQLEQKNLAPLKEYLSSLSASEVVEGLLQCEDKDKPVVFRLLPKELAIEVFEMLDLGVQGDLVEALSNEETLELLGQLDPDDQVRLFDELPAKVAKRLLNALPRQQYQAAARLMGYADDTVGRIMSPVYVDVKKNMTAGQALERIRRRKRGDDTVVNTVYITDQNRCLVGVLPLSTLVGAEPDTPVEALLKSESPEVVCTHGHQEEAARLLQQLNVVELPVLDREERLVGVLTFDDAMDVLREEVTDDMFDKVGLVEVSKRESDRSYHLLNGSFFHIVAVRVPFLLITLVGGMLAGLVIERFEETLQAVVATAVFIPVIMDMGGNVGTQSSTIFTRAMVLGQINVGQFIRYWLREICHGFGMGVILGIIGGLTAMFWQGLPALGLAVGVSLALTIMIAVAIGFLVPFALVKLGFDQAAGADPLITTIKDIFALLIYFTSVAVFLPQVAG